MNEIRDDVESLADDAGALMGSAASAAGKRYSEVRKGVSSVLKRGGNIYGNARIRAVKDTKAADAFIHDNLYRTVLVGAGVGIILGYLLARRGISSGG